MSQLTGEELLALHKHLTTAYLAATPGQRVRIDGALIEVERRLVHQRRCHFFARLRELLRHHALASTHAAVAAASDSVNAGGAALETAVVVRAVDGDTVVLADKRRVRYIGLDAPELFIGYHRLANPEPGATSAHAANQRLVTGRRVQLLADCTNIDRYGRLLRYVFCDGVFVNAQLVLTGKATFYPVPPNERFADLLARCEQHARRRRLGVWRVSLQP
jgi:endonuclease YncB( thermonuclease family)